MQGNKGGPAIALALMKQIESKVGECEFTFSVPGAELRREIKRAGEYGVEVVANFGPRDVLPPSFCDASRRVRGGSFVGLPLRAVRT